MPNYNSPNYNTQRQSDEDKCLSYVSGICIFIFGLGTLLCSNIQVDYVNNVHGDDGGLWKTPKMINMLGAQFELNHEWRNTKFVRSVFVVDGEQDCREEFDDVEPLFHYDWTGLRDYYSRILKDNVSEPTFTKSHRNGKSYIEHSMVSTGFPMLQISLFDGKRICGRKLNATYLDVKPVDAQENCIQGYTKCSGNGQKSIENQICLPNDKVPTANDCPITSVHFLSKDTTDKQGFTYTDYDADFKIGYSNEFDSLPVTQFQVQVNKPCISSQTGPQMTKKFNRSHYFNENQLILNQTDMFGQIRYSQEDDSTNSTNELYGCLNMSDGEYFSDQYQNFMELGPKIDVASMEQENEIDLILRNYSRAYPKNDIENLKANTYLSFWVKPVLKFEAECTPGATPSSLLEVLAKQIKNIQEGPFKQIPTLFNLRSLLCLASCGFITLRTDANSTGKAFAFCLPLGFFVTSVCIWISYPSLIKKNKAYLHTLKEFDEYNSKCISSLGVYQREYDIKGPVDMIDKLLMFEVILVPMTLFKYLIYTFISYFINDLREKEAELNTLRQPIIYQQQRDYQQNLIREQNQKREYANKYWA